MSLAVSMRPEGVTATVRRRAATMSSRVCPREFRGEIPRLERRPSDTQHLPMNSLATHATPHLATPHATPLATVVETKPPFPRVDFAAASSPSCNAAPDSRKTRLMSLLSASDSDLMSGDLGADPAPHLTPPQPPPPLQPLPHLPHLLHFPHSTPLTRRQSCQCGILRRDCECRAGPPRGGGGRRRWPGARLGRASPYPARLRIRAAARRGHAGAFSW
jgi:hypothetical protein